MRQCGGGSIPEGRPCFECKKDTPSFFPLTSNEDCSTSDAVIKPGCGWDGCPKAIGTGKGSKMRYQYLDNTYMNKKKARKQMKKVMNSYLEVQRQLNHLHTRLYVFRTAGDAPRVEGNVPVLSTGLTDQNKSPWRDLSLGLHCPPANNEMN